MINFTLSFTANTDASEYICPKVAKAFKSQLIFELNSLNAWPTYDTIQFPLWHFSLDESSYGSSSHWQKCSYISYFTVSGGPRQGGAAALPKSGRKSPLPLGFLARIVSGAGVVRVFQPPPAGTLLKKTTIS